MTTEPADKAFAVRAFSKAPVPKNYRLGEFGIEAQRDQLKALRQLGIAHAADEFIKAYTGMQTPASMITMVATAVTISAAKAFLRSALNFRSASMIISTNSRGLTHSR